MKHGIFQISFLGKTLYEVYIWIGNRKWGYVETFSSQKDALDCFNASTYDFDKRDQI